MDKQLLQKFLNQQCSPQEAEYVHNCLRQDPDLLSRLLPDEEWAEAGRDLLLMPNAETVFKRIKPNRTLLWHQFNWGSVAAVLAYAVLTILTVKYIIPAETRPQLSYQHTTPETRQIIVKNSGTTVQVINLKDGSIVKLSPNSTLQYPQPFPATQRNLILQGEATFDVAHDSTRPFTVTGQGINTTALGTSFRVRAFKATNVEVQLFKGKIRIARAAGSSKTSFNQVILYPGQQFRYAAGKVKITQFEQSIKQHLLIKKPKPIAPESPAAMVGGVLEFDKTPLTQVCKELSERYNQTINCEKVQKPILLTGQFNGTDKLKEILNKIALLNNLTIAQLPDGSYQITEEK